MDETISEKINHLMQKGRNKRGKRTTANGVLKQVNKQLPNLMCKYTRMYRKEKINQTRKA